MKKILMILSIAAFMAIPTTSLAQNTDNCNKCSEATACCQKKQCPDSCKQCDKQCQAKNDSCPAKANCKEYCKANCQECCKANCKECCKTACNKKCIADKKKDFRGERHGKKGFGKKMAPRDLFKDINLTAEQKQKVKALAQQARVDGQKARTSKDKKSAEDATKIISAYEKEIEKILTPEQFKQYQVNKEAMKNNRPARSNR